MTGWRADAELAHAALMRSVPLLERLDLDGDRTRLARAIERSLAAIYDACDGRDEPLQGLTRAAADAGTARAAIAADDEGPIRSIAEQLDRALGALGKAQDASAGELTRDAAEPPPIEASVELPRLHAVARASLIPEVRLPAPLEPPAPLPYEPLPSPTTFDELETWGKRAAEHIEAHLKQVFDDDGRTEAPPPPAPAGEPLFVRHFARECFEEVAMLSSQRRPLLGDDWKTTHEIELRMLWTLDAFAALGAGALGQIESLAIDAPIVDPPRAYAAAFLLGSVDGRDALGMAERIARWSGDDEWLEAFGDGLAVAPHPALGPMLDGWLDESDPRYRAVAARVLSTRGALSPERRRACLDDRPEVALHVLLPLALARDPAVELVLPEALASPYIPLRQAAWRSLALRSRPQAAERLRLELGGAHGDRAAPLLAAVGSRDDARRLLDHAMRNPTPAVIDAVAISGSIAAVTGLLELLGNDDPDIALAAAGALERITGAPLRRDVAMAPEKVDLPDLPEPDTGGFEGPMPLRDFVSDPRHAPSDGSPDAVELPPPDPDLWRAWWQEHRARFAPDKRYRMGQPFSALVAWQEIEGGTLSYAQRRRSSHELTTLLHDDAGFSPDAFVIQQQRALALWRPLAEKRVASAGAWAS